MRQELQLAYKLKDSDPGRAEAICNHILNNDPKDLHALFCVAHIHLACEHFGLASAIYARCMEIAPHQWEPIVNYALALISINEFVESERLLHKAIKMEPKSLPALNNLALINVQNGNPEKAIEYASRSLQIEPQQPEAQETMGYANLMLGNWREGWEGFEAMIGDSKYRQYQPLRNEPYWQGEKGGLLYLKGEQGLGDEISFASVIPDILNNNSIILDCDPKLEGLFRRSFPEVEVHGTRRDEKPWLGQRSVDYGALIGSVGRHYRNEGKDFPGTPYLVPDPERCIQWRALLDTLPGKKIGIAWTGGLNNTFAHRRSLTLETLLPILSIPGVSWVSLQYKDPMPEIAQFYKDHKIEIHHWKRGGESNDYDDQAALVSELDCIVSVQTAIVHLAGALGKKAFVLVPSKPRWFYGQSGKSIPWYNSVEIFRQTDKWPLESVRNAIIKKGLADMKEVA